MRLRSDHQTQWRFESAVSASTTPGSRVVVGNSLLSSLPRTSVGEISSRHSCPPGSPRSCSSTPRANATQSSFPSTRVSAKRSSDTSSAMRVYAFSSPLAPRMLSVHAGSRTPWESASFASTRPRMRSCSANCPSGDGNRGIRFSKKVPARSSTRRGRAAGRRGRCSRLRRWKRALARQPPFSVRRRAIGGSRACLSSTSLGSRFSFVQCSLRAASSFTNASMRVP